MKDKCALCESEIKRTFLEKPLGTIVKLGSGEESKKVFVCPACQKEHGEKLVEKLEEI
jgi:hypothetical protein